jgi:hypothetical protein
MREQKRKQVVADTSAPTDTIPFDDAVREGKEIVARLEDIERESHWRLGELADKLEPKYNDRTLAKFAEAIGIAACTLERHRSVYRKWKAIPAARPVSYAVLRALQDHPDRATIVEKQPNLTEREARKLMQGHRRASGKQRKQDQEEHWLKHHRKWFREFYVHAEEASRAAAVALNCEPEKQREMAQVIELRALMDLRGFGRMVVNFAEEYEKLLEEQEAEERAEHENAETSGPIAGVHSEAIAQAAA